MADAYAIPVSAIAALLAASPAVAAATAETVGVATQEADGTIVVQLRTPSDSGMVGDAIVRYPPGDSNYDVVSRHIGPIPKGGSVFVKRFEK